MVFYTLVTIKETLVYGGAEYTLGGWEGQWWDLIIDAVAISLQK